MEAAEVDEQAHVRHAGSDSTLSVARFPQRCVVHLGHEEPAEAAGAVDAKNAPTAPWKTPKQFSTATTGTAPLYGQQNERQGTFLFR